MMTDPIFEQTLRHFLSPIQSLMNNHDVSEIMINGPNDVYYEQRGRIYHSECRFRDESALSAAVQNIAEYVGRRIDRTNHSMDARLPNGCRVHAIIAPSSRQGTCLTIRKFQPATFQLPTLVELGSLTEQAAEFLSLAVQMHKNIIVSGGTGTGKTSLLNALSAAIPDSERIIVIEDCSELQLKQSHTIYLEAQAHDENGKGGVTVRDLFVDSLRMRPDRVIVGEVRRGEALDMIQSMISGHAGAMSTVHASSPQDAASRLETLCLMNEVGLPVYVARSQVASAIHLVVQITRFVDGTRRITSISESLGLDAENRYSWNEIFRFTGRGRDELGRVCGSLAPTGNRPSFSEEVMRYGYDDRVITTRDILIPPSPRSIAAEAPSALPHTPHKVDPRPG